MDDHDMSPYSESNTLEMVTPRSPDSDYGQQTTHMTTPASIISTPPPSAISQRTLDIPQNLSQSQVNEDPQLQRLQQDLLILTGFNENETLHWRPSWFPQGSFSKQFWTVHNPPNVVTERLPSANRGRQFFTRRMRQVEDPSSYYVQSWKHWARYCAVYGVPFDFLCEEQIQLVRLGLSKDPHDIICAPPKYPLYPEPQPAGRGRYILDPLTYVTHLPPKFHSVARDATAAGEVQAVVVHSDGTLKIELREPFFMHTSQWTHYDGYGGYRLDDPQIVDETAPKQQGPGRKWTYLPWTREQEESCRLLVKLKVGGKGRRKGNRLLRELM